MTSTSLPEPPQTEVDDFYYCEGCRNTAPRQPHPTGWSNCGLSTRYIRKVQGVRQADFAAWCPTCISNGTMTRILQERLAVS